MEFHDQAVRQTKKQAALYKRAMKAAAAVQGGRLLIDEPFTARQAVNTIGNFVKDPKKTLGFGVGGTLLIDQPFTTRQAVNKIGDFIKDPKKTIGFGLCHHCGSHAGRRPYRTVEHIYESEGAGIVETLSKIGNKLKPVLQVMKPTYLDQMGGLPEAIGAIGGRGMRERYMRQVEGEGYPKGSAEAREAMEKARSAVKGNKARMVKGSPEARAFMAKLRAMRGKAKE